jgi:hypothetical protein
MAPPSPWLTMAWTPLKRSALTIDTAADPHHNAHTRMLFTPMFLVLKHM